MTNRTTEEIARGLTELAERCEKARGPDRELDEAIALSIGWTLLDRRQGWGSPVALPPGQTIRSRARKFPAYTASLDAALTLAKEFGGQVTFFKDGTAKAFLWQPYPMAVEVKAATPALALTAACLRALAVRSHLESHKP